uniref:Endoribonuclease Dcr-1 n=1 Tax=Rhabditophanes sp. KR3021 TaxID=114890 RepID=A0AC35TIS6_9BILA
MAHKFGEVSSECLEPRDYQTSIFERAKKKNVIAQLPTGSGKTYIAVMLIKEFQNVLTQDYDKKGKRAFFIVNTVALAKQQAKAIAIFCSLKIGELNGESSYNITSKGPIQECIKEKHVIVITAQILVDLINHNIIKFDKIALMVLDECHHVMGASHPYACIMEQYKKFKGDKPAILGLTASLINARIKADLLGRELKKLENKMQARIVTADTYSQLNQFCPIANEKHIPYQKYTATVDPITERIDVLTKLFQTSCKNEYFDVKPKSNITKDISESLQQIRSCFDNLGSYSVYLMCNFWKSQFTKLSKDPTNSTIRSQFLKTAISTLDHIRQMLHKIFGPIKTFEELSKYLSNRLHIVLKAIVGFQESVGDDETNRLACIVFVQERVITLAITKIIKQLPNFDLKYSYIHADYVVGYTASMKSEHETITLCKMQENALHKFKAGFLNTLIATEVLEEGVDVRQCNMVIRFDLPANFRSYIQSRGRIRKNGGHYLILYDIEEKETFSKILKEYHNIERLIKQHCISDDGNNEGSFTNEELKQVEIDYPPFVIESTGACVNLKSSIQLVNKYCQKLPSDNFTVLSVKTIITEVQVTDKIVLYVAELILPTNCPYRSVIKIRKPVPSRKLAIMAVCLETCKILRQENELDERLLPNGKEKFKALQSLFENYDEEVDVEDTHIGGSKRKQPYDKKISKFLGSILPGPGEKAFLYTVRINLIKEVNETMNPKNRKIINPLNFGCTFGFLSKNLLPQTPSFQIFMRQGCCEVKIVNSNKKVTLTEEELIDCQKFHDHLFVDVLQCVRNEVDFAPYKSSLQVVFLPLKRDGMGADGNCDFIIDMEYIRDSLDGFDKLNIVPTDIERHKFVFKREDFLNSVVFPWYRQVDIKTYFYVGDIYNDMTPKSDFPDKNYETFEEYFCKKYEKVIYNTEQNLLDVDFTSNRLNLLTPRYPGKKVKESRGERGQRQIMVPELVTIHPISADHWCMIGALPSVIFRLNSLLLANELREAVVVGALEQTDIYEGEFESLQYKTSFDEDPSQNKVSITESEEVAVSPVATEVDGQFSIGVWDPQTIVDFEPSTKEHAVFPITENDSDIQGMRGNDDLMMSDEDEDEDLLDNSSEYVINLDAKEQAKKIQDKLAPKETIEPMGWDDVNIVNTNVNQISTKAVIVDVQDLIKNIEPGMEDTANGTKPAKKKTVKSAGNKMAEQEDVIDLSMYDEGESSNVSNEEGFDSHLDIYKYTDTYDFKKILLDKYTLTAKLDDDMKNMFDGVENDDRHRKGVNPAILLQALTSSSANDGFNLERLETIGDSFLKFSVTDYLYHENDKMHEGNLSIYRSREVSNLKLYILGKKKCIPNLMITTKFEPQVNWLPPGYITSDGFKPDFVAKLAAEEDLKVESFLNAEFNSDASHINVQSIEREGNWGDEGSGDKVAVNGFNINNKKKGSGDSDEKYSQNMFLQQTINDKTIADSVEALIGAHFLHVGINGALKFMKWMGISVYRNMREPEELNPILDYLNCDSNPNGALEQLAQYYHDNRFHQIEKEVGYVFKNKGYLIQAFSHASYIDNRVTGCYQRLEFLGDAVLDFVVTRYLYSHKASYSPGDLTDLRSSLVNNIILASLAVKYQFNKYFLARNPKIDIMIEKFVDFCKETNYEIANFHTDMFMMSEDDPDNDGTEDIEVPKALGDIFESFIGAVYLDSGRDLAVVWTVIYSMMKDVLVQYCNNPPKSPVRELMERYPDQVSFVRMERNAVTEKIKVYAEISNKVKLTGQGRSYKIAKTNAAKRALRYLVALDESRAKEKLKKN